MQIEEAGVDQNHQISKCDHCNKKLKTDEGIRTCSHTEYLTLCQECYKKAGNTVR